MKVGELCHNITDHNHIFLMRHRKDYINSAGMFVTVHSVGLRMKGGKRGRGDKGGERDGGKDIQSLAQETRGKG